MCKFCLPNSRRQQTPASAWATPTFATTKTGSRHNLASEHDQPLRMRHDGHVCNKPRHRTEKKRTIQKRRTPLQRSQLTTRKGSTQGMMIKSRGRAALTPPHLTGMYIQTHLHYIHFPTHFTPPHPTQGAKKKKTQNRGGRAAREPCSRGERNAGFPVPGGYYHTVVVVHDQIQATCGPVEETGSDTATAGALLEPPPPARANGPGAR